MRKSVKLVTCGTLTRNRYVEQRSRYV